MPRWIVVMGVSGSGKSSLGGALARELNLPFIEGDALHPPSNVDKMSAGAPLTDDDRWPWLDTCAGALRDAEDGAVLACSALRAIYRQRLRERAQHPLTFVWLKVGRAILTRRLQGRRSHYMPASLLDSQLATLEPPAAEQGVIVLDSSKPLRVSLEEAMRALD